VSRGRRRAAAGRPPTEFTVRHRESSPNSYNEHRMSGTRRLPRGRIAKRGPIRTRSSPSDSAEGVRDENRRPERVRGKGDSGGAPKVGENRFFAPHKNSAPSRAQGSRRRTPGVGGRHRCQAACWYSAQGPVGGGKKIGKRAKTAFFDDGSRKPAATPVETTSDGRGRRRPTRRRNRRRSGPVGRKVGSKNGREKIENRTIRGQPSEPPADRSPSTESDENRRADAATRRPPGQKISSRSKERFGCRGRSRETTRRARRQKGQSTRAARRRTRRRRGTDARNSRQYGERRVGGTE
jgi:hypothetical protein